MYVVSLWSRLFFLRWITTPPTEHNRYSVETLGDLEPVYDLFPIMSEFTLPEAGGDTNIIICICHLYEEGHFSYSESPRTPPLEGTSLHRWNNSVERPWGIWACLWPFHDYEWFQPARGCMWHRHVGSLWSKLHGTVCFSYHGSARGGRGGGTHLFFQFPMAVTQAHGIQVN